jgi:hypothetical protein
METVRRSYSTAHVIDHHYVTDLLPAFDRYLRKLRDERLVLCAEVTPLTTIHLRRLTRLLPRAKENLALWQNDSVLVVKRSVPRR